MKTIDPNIDRYGTYARASCLADYVELLALSGQRFTKSHLADLVVDSEWARRDVIAFVEDDDDDTGEDWATTVYAMLAERADVLGDLYPFRLAGEQLIKRDGVTSESYRCLLAVTVAHAWRLATNNRPERLLETLVADFMAQLSLEAVDFAARARGAGGFDVAVRRAGESVMLRPTPGAAPRNRRAQDAGVDVLANLWTGDHRPGRWTFVGQATCGKSDTWERKLGEPRPPLWAQYIGDPVDPAAFLAVPHHVEARQLRHLVEGSRCVVLDRLRLARLRRPLTADERALVDDVFSTPVTSAVA